MRDPPCVGTRVSSAPHVLLHAGALYACCCCCVTTAAAAAAAASTVSPACAAGAAARTILLHLPLLGVLLIRPALRLTHTGTLVLYPPLPKKMYPSY